MQPNAPSAMGMVAEDPVRLVVARRAVCDGGEFRSALACGLSGRGSIERWAAVGVIGISEHATGVRGRGEVRKGGSTLAHRCDVRRGAAIPETCSSNSVGIRAVRCAALGQYGAEAMFVSEKVTALILSPTRR